MTKQGCGNFAFLFEKDLQTYTDLMELESQLRLDFHWTGVRIRGVLALVMDKVVEKNGLQQEFPESLIFTQRLMKLLHYRSLSQPVMPYANEITTFFVLDEHGVPTTSQDTYYNFLRKLGNAFRDGPRPLTLPEASYTNTLLAIRLLHKIFKKLYDAESAPDFDPDRIPYGGFIPDAIDEAADLQEGCYREILAHTMSDNDRQVEYALLRVYRVDGKYAPQRQRVLDRMNQIQSKVLLFGMPIVHILNAEAKNVPFLIVAYVFHRNVQMLNNRLLQTLDLPQRLKLCSQLAEIFQDLHREVLYHGSVDPTCVFIAPVRARLAAWVAKFDRTPFHFDMTPQDLSPAIANFLARYVPPERASSSDPVDPLQADVYSLGVLLGDILYGKLTPEQPPTVFFHVCKMPIPTPVSKIIGQMCNTKPELRPNMGQVMNAFQEVTP